MKTRLLFFVLLFVFVVCGCKEKSGPHIVIYHTNDIQGFYWPRNFAENNNRPTGGLAVLKEMLSHNGGQYFLFDSGNSFSVTQEGKLFKLEGAIKLMNEAGYTAATLSYADLALGWEVVQKAISQAEFPIVVSNLELKDGSSPKNIKRYIITEKSGIKAAVLGVMSKKDFPDILRNSSLQVTDEISALKKLLPKIEKEKPDIIILLSSIGFDLDATGQQTDERQIAEEIPEINLILGGNGEVSGTDTDEVSGTLLTRNSPMLFEAGKIILNFNSNKQFISYDFKGILLDKELFGQDEILAQQVQDMRSAAAKITGRKITNLKNDFPTYNDKPSPLGTYSAACIKRWGRSEIGIINSDAFLEGFKAGSLSEVQLSNAMPFNDRVMFIKMRGDELKNALEYSIATKNNWPQTSGLDIIYDDTRPLGQKIIKIRVNGAPLVNERIYSVSVSDHIVAGGMGHDEFLNVFEFKNTDRTVLDILKWCFFREKDVYAPAVNDWKKQK